MAKWRARASSERSETESTGRLLNIIFSTWENFSLFRSPTIVAVAVVFQEDRHGTTGGERSFPFLRFRSYVPTACSRGARRAASLLVLSFVNLDERSRLRPPPFFIPFFLPPRVVDDQVVADERLTRWCSSPSPSAKDDDRRKSVEIWRRMREWECQREIAGICCFRFETSLGIKLRVESTRGALSFHWLDMIYNCEFYVIDGIFGGFSKKSFMSKISYDAFHGIRMLF